MKDIVEHTKLSKGAFYHYFSSKEQLFEEVIDYFFADFMNADFSKYSQDSLAQFCRDYLDDVEDKIASGKKLVQHDDGVFTANHYFLMFDALKMLPSFKQKLMGHDINELNAWKKIVRTAKKNKEISTTMTDEQVAKLYIYVNDGFGIRLLLNDNMDYFATFRGELQKLFNEIYNLLKA